MPKLDSGQALYAEAKKYIPGGTQLLSKRPEMFLPEQWPSYYQSANGIKVVDLDGREYLDFSHMGVGTCPLGYSDEDVNRAVAGAVSRGSMCTLNCPEEVELARELCRIHPWADKVRFARTGGESMTIAVRIARAATRRSHIILCGYHGWHDWYLSANLQGDVLGGSDLLLPGLDPGGVPNELKGTVSTFQYNDIESVRSLIKKHPTAAIVCETQRGQKPAPAFFPELKKLAEDNGALLILDEITSGFRLNVGGLHLQMGIEPHIAVLGKAMGNGYAIGAVIGTAEAMEIAQDSFISSTYWTERIGPTAALATLEKLDRTDACKKMTAAGLRVQSIWAEQGHKVGLDIHAGPEAMPPLSHLSWHYENARAVQTLWCQMMLEQGFLDNCGFYATAAHTDEMIDRYEEAVKKVFPQMASAIESGTVESSLRGPVGHSGFRRLTS